MNRPWSLILFSGCSPASRAYTTGHLPARAGLGASPFGSCWGARPHGDSRLSPSFRKRPNEVAC